MAASSSSSSSKPTSFNQKLIIISLLLLSSSILLFVLSFKPELQLQQQQSYEGNLQPKKQPNNNNNDHLLLKHRPKWLHVIGNHIKAKRIKVGLVNINHSDEENGSYSVRDKHVEAVHVNFDRVGDDKKWEDFFPDWIDEDHKWGPPRCPEMPVAKPEEDYRDLDVIVARVPCGGGGVDNEKEGIRDVFRLQVNLVVANLAVESGEWVMKEKKKTDDDDDDDDDRTVYVVFVGKCGAMMEMFRCDDLVENVGDYWIYKPDLGKLKQKVLMPVGSCQIAQTTGEFLFVF